MTPTPPSTTSSSAGVQSPDNQQHKVIRKRNRVPLSCGPCRHRKLKCNRQHPCDNCSRRGDVASCTYAAPGNRRRHGSGESSSGSPDEMQGRIDRLESLVLSLMNNGPQATGAAATAPFAPNTRSLTDTHRPDQVIDEDDTRLRQREDDSDVESMAKSIGIMKVQNDRQFYASEAHWWAILSDIAEVKSYFAEHKKQYDEQMKKVAASKPGNAAPGTSMLFKGVRKLDKEEILRNFPQRPIANALIGRYFQTENPSAKILHRPSFRRMYERHWADPQESSVIWLGLCFGMMTLAMQSYHGANDEPDELRGQSWQQSNTYLEWTTQCLVHADFTSPTNFMIETLCLYLQSEHNRSRDAETGVWILVGIVTRLALRMGLHRDPAPYAALTPFQGEMRRRIWNFIRSADVFLSFQVGLPGTLRSKDTDTALPSNLHDEEFNEDTKVLPGSRPNSELTPMSFMITQYEFVFILGRIMEDCNAIGPMSYDEVMKFDGELNETRNRTPPQLRMQSREDSALDPGELIMQRYTIDLIYYKSLLVLHRKFLARARENPRYAHSRRTCIDSALEILNHQLTISMECQPGGRLAGITWQSSSSSMTLSDFLLAAMIVCLDLYHTAQAESSGQTNDEMYTWAAERRETMFIAIERTVVIWENIKDQSMEAYKASAILRIMLEKLKNHQALRAQLNNNFSFAVSGGGVAPDGHVAPEHSAAMTLGMMSSGMAPETMNMFERGNYLQAQQQQQQQQQPPRSGLTPQPTQNGDQQQGGYAPVDAASPFSNLFGPNLGGFQGMEMPGSTFDWDTWDTYVQGSTLDNSVQNMMYFDPALTDATAPLTAQQQAALAADTKMHTAPNGPSIR